MLGHVCKRALLGIVLPLAAVQTGWGASAPVVADTYISSSLPTNNFGTLANLNVGAGSQALIKFDVAGSLPAGIDSTKISKAVLRLWVNKVGTARFDRRCRRHHSVGRDDGHSEHCSRSRDNRSSQCGECGRILRSC